MLMADVRYTLRCEIESTDKMLTQSGAMRDAMKDCTSEIFQTGERQMSRTARMTQIVEYATESTVVIDHSKKTWTRSSARDGSRQERNRVRRFRGLSLLKTPPLRSSILIFPSRAFTA